MMPPGARPAARMHAATLARVVHARADRSRARRAARRAGAVGGRAGPRLRRRAPLYWVRRDDEKAPRAEDLAAELTRRGARPAGLARGACRRRLAIRDALAQQVELGTATSPASRVRAPYDALLDDFEPGLTTAELPRCSRAARRAGAARRRRRRRRPGAQRRRVRRQPSRVAARRRPRRPRGRRLDDRWRLDPTLHPFASGIAADDVRITTRYDERRLRRRAVLRPARVRPRPHEAGSDRRLLRTTLDDPVSLGVHESQSRCGRRFGRSRPFCAWLSPPATAAGAVAGLAPPGCPRREHGAAALIRTEADETTYNLHVILRFELELAMIEGSLAIDDVPSAWDAGMERLLGIEVPGGSTGAAGRPLGRRADRLLPDLHARQPDRRADVGAAARRPVTSTPRSSAASSRRCASGYATTCTATAASSCPELLRRITGEDLRVDRSCVPARETGQRGRPRQRPDAGFVVFRPFAAAGNSVRFSRRATTYRRSGLMSLSGSIVVAGAREHNLKDVTSSCRATRWSSSPACPAPASTSWRSTRSTRRASDGTSSRCRRTPQFLGQMDKPDMDRSRGCRRPSRSTRDHVAQPAVDGRQVTEIYDYLRLLWAAIGRPQLKQCGLPIRAHSRRR